ncbi:hypothetical protein GXM_08328 [Nostoc sphaeroides CCNUC1]|uniref:Uncharacterized protein n=1 Tax=Nostoc sphaeroides CCNUC1 TaxID=2653204 RepID=A0A5P8WDW0_9NOSO|nr:hypothetical protein GXM_08328 [Nostoc sphaeroides CCNUC1]
MWIRIPLPFPPYATSSPPPFPGGKRAVYSPKIHQEQEKYYSGKESDHTG